jgi:hypothetical protein
MRTNEESIMIQYILRRVLLMIPTLIVTKVLTPRSFVRPPIDRFPKRHSKKAYT